MTSRLTFFTSLRTPARAIVGVLSSALVFANCAYYNGVYNAKEAAGKGDSRLRQGRVEESRTFFSQSAMIAETTLVRFPKSKWRNETLLLAGRGAALSGNCDTGVERLRAYLALPAGSVPERDYDRARLALSVCDVIYRRLSGASLRLDSLILAKDPTTAREARLWAGRAALAIGDRDGASRYFSTLDATSTQWELFTASMQAGDFSRAESLLVQRAASGDWRPDVTSALRDLWRAGRFDGAEEIVRRYDEARLRDSWRAGMHFMVGDFDLQMGRDSLARQHLFTARRLAPNDSAIDREAAARLAMLPLARVIDLADLDTMVARIDTVTRRTMYYRRMSDQLLLYRILEADKQPTGAPWFLAAEVARDSLRAPRLAHTMFKRIARELPSAPLAPKALHAAAVLQPDSAPAYRERILTNYASSSVAAWLRGDERTGSTDVVAADSVLRQAFLNGARSYADTLRKLREAAARANAAKASAVGRP